MLEPVSPQKTTPQKLPIAVKLPGMGSGSARLTPAVVPAIRSGHQATEIDLGAGIRPTPRLPGNGGEAHRRPHLPHRTDRVHPCRAKLCILEWSRGNYCLLLGCDAMTPTIKSELPLVPTTFSTNTSLNKIRISRQEAVALSELHDMSIYLYIAMHC